MPPLTPEQQLALVQFLMGGGAGPYSPTLNPGSFDVSYGQTAAELDDEGNMLPWGLDQENMAATYLNKRNNMMGDFMTAAQAGPGAFAQGAFDPIVTKEELVRRPGDEKLQFYLSRPGTPEFFIANEIAEGGTAMTAFAKLNQIISGEPKDEQAAELQAQMKASLPMVVDPTTGMEKPDLSSVQKIAMDLESAIVSDPVGNYVDPETGAHYNREVEDSQAAQVFKQLGLPLPTEEYGVSDLMGGDWAEQAASHDQRSQMRGEAPRSYARQISGAARGSNQAGPSGGGRRMQPRDNRGNGPAGGPLRAVMADYATRQPAWEREGQELNRERKQLFGADYGRALGESTRMREQGRTPLTDALMQRRMAMMAMGLQGGGYLPGM